MDAIGFAKTMKKAIASLMLNMLYPPCFYVLPAAKDKAYL